MTKHAINGAASRSDRTTFLALFGALGLACATDAQAAAPPAPSETSVVAQRLWGKLLTRCGDDAFYAGSIFDASGMLASVQAYRATYFQFRNPRFHIVPIALTPAEQANGVTVRARISMLSQIYREPGEPWQDGPGAQARNTEDMFARLLRSTGGDQFELGRGGAMALELVKHKGRWSATRLSTSGGIIALGRPYYFVDDLIATPADRYSCQTGTVIPRPPTPEEAAKLAEEAKKKAEEDRIAKLHAQVEAERKEQERRDDIERAAYQAEHDRKMKPWRFEGAFGPFTSKLTMNLIKRGQQYGFNPMDYTDEVTAINRMVQSCFRFTAADWRRARDFRGSAKAKNELLENCEGYSKIPVSPAGKPHGLVVQRSLSDVVDNKFVWAGKLRVIVSMTPTQEDHEKAGRPPVMEYGPAFTIVDATFPMTTTVARGAQ
ncbi:MAG: hypothetical protein JNL41_10065 [Phenylobacterium sp.]|uniref:hypothetical protein n=1 Tax=Phenylobacterium sp. TaxID=1871053 RepID=UPI001A50AA5A|nr:hypothetical protein [Phenylobacterium sp.]MBL8554611.1 hypothetical protein [Phenylobacterium sp.]